MGTRATTRIYVNGKPLMNLYRQYDGYPDAHGKALYDIISGREMVNGISGCNYESVFNGPECLAAAMVGMLKENNRGRFGAGGIYLYPTDEDISEDFNYKIFYQKISGDWKTEYSEPRIEVDTYGGRKIFDGSLEEFGEFVSQEEW